MTATKRFRTAARVLGTVAFLVACLFFFAIRRVDQAFAPKDTGERDLEWAPLSAGEELPFWGSQEIESVVQTPAGVYIAGGEGVARLVDPGDARGRGFGRRLISQALPSRRVSALSAWRTALAAALESGGLFFYSGGDWSELRSGYGLLHVRALAESEAGELWVGAREGLFRIGFAERTIARLHAFPVKAIAMAEGGRVLSGGEQGLRSTQGGITTTIAVEGAVSAWVDDLAVVRDRLFAVTATGLVAGALEGPLRPVPEGQDVGSIAANDASLLATSNPAAPFVRRFDRALRVDLQQTRAEVRRVFAVDGRVLADTTEGLMEQAATSWRIVLPRERRGSSQHAHVGAIAWFRDAIHVGFFDGGLARLDSVPAHPAAASEGVAEGERWRLRDLPQDAIGGAWAVNALLDAGGALHVASLRGAFRFDGARATPLRGIGASFSLASTRSGIAIGLGEGALLPDGRLISGFHGLPGNQATALLAESDGLIVGTPSGIGYIEGRRVVWRAGSGEGKLPHPWVTSVLQDGDSVLVGTYGGGVVRRSGPIGESGDWTAFAETAGLKINTGAMARVNGRVYAGTDGDGLFRLSVSGTRFERLKLSLPSMRITALFERDGFLYIGTDEGLTRWRVE